MVFVRWEELLICLLILYHHREAIAKRLNVVPVALQYSERMASPAIKYKAVWIGNDLRIPVKIRTSKEIRVEHLEIRNQVNTNALCSEALQAK